MLRSLVGSEMCIRDSLNVTKYETLAKAGNGLPQGEWRFDVVDVTDHVIIYTENTRVGVQTPAGAPTVTCVSPPTGPTGVPNPVIPIPDL